jgi:prepilin-type N-terminal cleavage/methylation domain-containing protein
MTKRRRRVSGDAGVSLMELMVAMVVMAIVGAIFIGAVVTMYDSSNHSQAVADTSQELNLAFSRLDTQVRYASYVSIPGQDANDGGNWYVELQDANASPAVCTQLRVDQVSRQLQQRTWSGAAAPGAWQPLASGVVNGAATGSGAPFVVTVARGVVRSTQLAVNLLTSEGSGTRGAVSQSAMTFTSLNTNPTTPIGGICAGQRP